jgi:hypothetical protein
MNTWSLSEKNALKWWLARASNLLFSRKLTGLVLFGPYLCGADNLNPWPPRVSNLGVECSIGTTIEDLHSPQNGVIEQD